jgi:hypothetical protein
MLDRFDKKKCTIKTLAIQQKIPKMLFSRFLDKRPKKAAAVVASTSAEATVTRVLPKQRVDYLCTLSEDILLNVCKFLVSEPKILYWLAQMNSFLKSIIHPNTDLWMDVLHCRENKRFVNLLGVTSQTRTRYFAEQFFKNIPVDLHMSPVLNFRPMATGHFVIPVSSTNQMCAWPPRVILEEEKMALVEHSRKIALLDGMCCCGICGHKYKHFAVWELNTRLCDMCFRDNLISSNDLFLHYGVDFWALFKQDKSLFESIFCFTMDVHANNPRAIVTRYSWAHLQNPVFQRPHMTIPTPNVFFWMPHMKQKFDLMQMKETKLTQMKCACLLSAKVRALYIRQVIIFRGIPWTMARKLLGDVSRKGTTLSRDTMYSGIRMILLGTSDNHPAMDPRHGLKTFLDRFLHRRSITMDHNQRKILEILRNYESLRTFYLEKYTIPNARNGNYALMNAFKKLADTI